MSHWLIKNVSQQTATVIRFMMREDGVRFVQLVHELQPRIRAFEFTRFMCSAWIKPVCTHTMGCSHKTVNASPVLTDPSAWRSFSVKDRVFHQSPFISIISRNWFYCQNARSKVLLSLQCKGSSTMCQHSSLLATSLLDHANLLWWQIKGPESSTPRVIWSTPAVG